MGLDMYLKKGKKIPKISWEEYRKLNDRINEGKDDKLLNKYKDYVQECGNYGYKWTSLTKEVGYWRKANQIHKWFVDNVQDGVDDCDEYLVSKDDLVNLLETCKEVIANSELIPSKVYVGSKYEDGKEIKMYEDGKVIKDSTVADELLPSCSGFFFGHTDYDEYYLDDLEHTVDLLENVINTTDFDNEYITYQSSW